MKIFKCISVLLFVCILFFGCGRNIPKDKFAGIWVSDDAYYMISGGEVKKTSTFDYKLEESFQLMNWRVIVIEKNKEENEYTAKFRVYEIPHIILSNPDSCKDWGYRQDMDGIGKESGNSLNVTAIDYGVNYKETHTANFTYDEKDDTISWNNENNENEKFKRFDENTFLQFRDEFIEKTALKLREVIGYKDNKENNKITVTVNNIDLNYINLIKYITSNRSHLIDIGMSKKSVDRALREIPEYWSEYKKPEETITIDEKKRKIVEHRYWYNINRNEHNPVAVDLIIDLRNDRVNEIFFGFKTNDELIAKMMYSAAFEELEQLGAFKFNKSKYSTYIYWTNSYDEIRLSTSDEKSITLNAKPPLSNEWNESEDIAYHVGIERSIRK